MRSKRFGESATSPWRASPEAMRSMRDVNAFAERADIVKRDGRRKRALMQSQLHAALILSSIHLRFILARDRVAELLPALQRRYFSAAAL